MQFICNQCAPEQNVTWGLPGATARTYLLPEEAAFLLIVGLWQTEEGSSTKHDSDSPEAGGEARELQCPPKALVDPITESYLDHGGSEPTNGLMDSQSDGISGRL